MTGREELTPYCVAEGCADLPPTEHLREHLRWGCTGPEQAAELLAAYDAARRTDTLNAAADALLTGYGSARTTGQRVGRLHCIDALRQMAGDTDPDARDASGPLAAYVAFRDAADAPISKES